jgi:hypothetical protein
MASRQDGKITIRLPERLLKDFKIRCIENGLHQSDGMRRAIESWLGLGSAPISIAAPKPAPRVPLTECSCQDGVLDRLCPQHYEEAAAEAQKSN